MVGTRRVFVVLAAPALGWLIAAGSPVIAGSYTGVLDPGDQLWASRYEGPEGDDDTAYAIGLAPDGTRVFVAGEVNGPNESLKTDIGAVAYDAASGAQLWNATFGSNGGDVAYDLAGGMNESCGCETW